MRRRIAVLQSGAKVPDLKNQAGEGLTAMANTALTSTDQFILVKCGELYEVIKEQRLGGSGEVRRARALAPAQQSA